jgi:hypothetical protein
VATNCFYLPKILLTLILVSTVYFGLMKRISSIFLRCAACCWTERGADCLLKRACPSRAAMPLINSVSWSKSLITPERGRVAIVLAGIRADNRLGGTTIDSQGATEYREDR